MFSHVNYLKYKMVKTEMCLCPDIRVYFSTTLFYLETNVIKLKQYKRKLLNSSHVSSGEVQVGRANVCSIFQLHSQFLFLLAVRFIFSSKTYKIHS